MKSKRLLSGFIYSLIGFLIFMQTNIVLAIASDPNNPITAAITAAITGQSSNQSETTNQASSSAQPTATQAPISTSITNPTPEPTSAPISAPIVTTSPTPSPTASATPTTGTYLVKPYLVYPADKTMYPAYETAVNNYLVELQNWYLEQVGKTFVLEPLQVVRSSYNYDTMRCDGNQACLNDPSRLDGNWAMYMNKAIHNGSENWDQHSATLVFSAGGGGFAGANKYANDTGWAVVGDWVLEPISGVTNTWGIPCTYSDGWQCSGGTPKGTPAHELGHAFGLDHPTSGQSVMNAHWGYPTAGLLPQEVEFLRQSPFFNHPVIETPVINSVSPNSVTLGSWVTLTGSGFNNTSKVYISGALMNPNDMKVGIDGKSLMFVLDPELSFKSGETHGVAVVNGETISNTALITIAPSVIQTGVSVSSNQKIVAPAVTLDSTHPEVVLASSNFNTAISIPSNVPNPTINFANLLTTTPTKSEAIFNNIVTISSQTSAGTVNVEIPALTTITGPANWDGKMNAPQVLSTNQASPVADSGKSTQVQTVIEVGLGDTALTFDKAVRLLIPNQAGKLVGFQRGSTFTKITQSCASDTQTAGDALTSGSECYISSGSDLVIWTKHFTKFVTYTQSTNSSSTGGTSQATYNTQAPGCFETKPTGAPKLLSAKVSGRNEVTLTWSKALDPVTYYLITYGTKSNKPEFGNPNVGGKDTTSYVVKGLDNNKTYYFKVRAGNGCMPGEFSNEVAVKASGDKINTQASGFKAGVLSANDQKASTSAEAKFKPITAAEPQRAVTSAGNIFSKVINFFTSIFSKK